LIIKSLWNWNEAIAAVSPELKEILCQE
jgi:hypothetical protein